MNVFIYSSLPQRGVSYLNLHEVSLVFPARPILSDKGRLYQRGLDPALIEKWHQPGLFQDCLFLPAI